jgi:crossover junction endodeoxyribonuclease RusA
VSARQASFQVIGDPAPQGSKTAFVAGGKARMKEASGSRFTVWRDAVAQAAFDEARGLAQPLDGPLMLSVIFRFKMPASRSKAWKALGIVEKSTAPDLSKLIRAAEDAMQAAGLISDDARICGITARKFEVHNDWTGCSIVIAEVAA